MGIVIVDFFHFTLQIGIQRGMDNVAAGVQLTAVVGQIQNVNGFVDNMFNERLVGILSSIFSLRRLEFGQSDGLRFIGISLTLCQSTGIHHFT